MITRRMIWWFYRALKDYRLAPTPVKAERLRAQFDRIFNRMRTGYGRSQAGLPNSADG